MAQSSGNPEAYNRFPESSRAEYQNRCMQRRLMLKGAMPGRNPFSGALRIWEAKNEDAKKGWAGMGWRGACACRCYRGDEIYKWMLHCGP